jgi:hypothetical protein
MHSLSYDSAVSIGPLAYLDGNHTHSYRYLLTAKYLLACLKLLTTWLVAFSESHAHRVSAPTTQMSLRCSPVCLLFSDKLLLQRSARPLLIRWSIGGCRQIRVQFRWQSDQRRQPAVSTRYQRSVTDIIQPFCCWSLLLTFSCRLFDLQPA